MPVQEQEGESEKISSFTGQLALASVALTVIRLSYEIAYWSRFNVNYLQFAGIREIDKGMSPSRNVGEERHNKAHCVGC